MPSGVKGSGNAETLRRKSVAERSKLLGPSGSIGNPRRRVGNGKGATQGTDAADAGLIPMAAVEAARAGTKPPRKIQPRLRPGWLEAKTRDPVTGLTEIERLFVDAYCGEAGGIASKALQIASGGAYADGSPGIYAHAHKIATRPHVAHAISLRRQEVLTRLGASVERVNLELARIAFSDPRSLFGLDGKLLEPTEWSETMAAAVRSFEVSEHPQLGRKVKVTLWDKGKALETILLQLRPDLGKPEEQGAKERPLVEFNFNIRRPTDEEIAEGSRRTYDSPSMPSGVPQINRADAVRALVEFASANVTQGR